MASAQSHLLPLVLSSTHIFIFTEGYRHLPSGSLHSLLCLVYVCNATFWPNRAHIFSVTVI